MESRHDGDALVINPMPAGTDNTRIMPQKETERHFSESDDNFRLQEAYFFRQPPSAAFIPLCNSRRAVSSGAAFYDICDIYMVTRNPYRQKSFIMFLSQKSFIQQLS